jgi:adenosylmethionine-8-amino-7-oxononanoate aminotransferase
MSHRYPESPVFYRRLDRSLPLAVRAAGAWILDEAGRGYLDASGGAVVASLGHDLGEVADAVAEEIRRLGYVNAAQFTSEACEALAAELVEVLPEPLRYVYFLGSGSEAVEAAVKLARQYHIESGRVEKWKVISRVPSYHGNTLGALGLSGRDAYREGFAPLLVEHPRVPAPDPWRRPQDPWSTGAALEAELERQDPKTVAALLAEPIGGSSAGAAVPARGYWPRMVETCRRHDVLWIADEVMTGLGRTGRWFAFQHFDVVPDILVLGKALSGGAVPLSAVVASRPIVDTIAAGSGAFRHAQTFSHHPALCAAGVAVLRRMKRERLVEQVAELEETLFAVLARLKRHRHVGDIRGRGLLAAIELVADRETKQPFLRAEKVAERLAAAAFEEGLIVWPNAGNVDGVRGDLIMIAPPYTASREDLVEIGRRLDKALDRVP